MKNLILTLSIFILIGFSAAQAEMYGYDAYGVRTVYDGQGNELNESAIGNPLGFQGRYHDEETGLIYFRGRYQDPKQGRFISRDPKGYVDGMNLFAFEANNPLNNLDPMGLKKVARYNHSEWSNSINPANDLEDLEDVKKAAKAEGYDVYEDDGYEISDAWHSLKDVLEDSEWNDIIFLHGHRGGKGSGLKDADDKKWTVADMKKQLEENSGSIGVLILGQCDSCITLKALCATGKIRIGIGFRGLMNAQAGALLQEKFAKEFLSGKTAEDALKTAITVYNGMYVPLKTGNKPDPAEICTCFGAGMARKSTVKDLNDKKQLTRVGTAGDFKNGFK